MSAHYVLFSLSGSTRNITILAEPTLCYLVIIFNIRVNSSIIKLKVKNIVCVPGLAIL